MSSRATLSSAAPGRDEEVGSPRDLEAVERAVERLHVRQRQLRGQTRGEEEEEEEEEEEGGGGGWWGASLSASLLSAVSRGVFAPASSVDVEDVRVQMDGQGEPGGEAGRRRRRKRSQVGCRPPWEPP